MPTDPPTRITRLARIAAAPERTILGLMSGTSLDGLDLALCRIAGHGPATRVSILHHATRPYTAAEKERIRAVAFRENVSLRTVTQLHGWLAELHAQGVLAQLAAWGVAREQVDAIASHGQTVYHAPERAPPLHRVERGPGGEGLATPPSPHGEGVASRGTRDDGGEVQHGHTTLQLGDGDRLAVRTGILTVSDFRQKEIAGGGEGAPLVPYAEALCFAAPGRSRVLLNIGGIANFTWLPPVDAPSRWIAGDSGPGNTLLDRAVREAFPERPEGYDPQGALAAEGRVHAAALAPLKAHPYFARPFPKSTGPEEFGAAFVADTLAALGREAPARHDLIATLTRLTAETIADAIRRTVSPPAGAELIVSGGGALNRTLLRWLAELLPGVTLHDSAVLGIPPEAKEAVLFAVLANETLAGEGFTVRRESGRDGSGRRVGFGKLSFPD